MSLDRISVLPHLRIFIPLGPTDPICTKPTLSIIRLQHGGQREGTRSSSSSSSSVMPLE